MQVRKNKPEVPKWPTGADCKSAGLALRRFESFPLDTEADRRSLQCREVIYDLLHDLNCLLKSQKTSFCFTALNDSKKESNKSYTYRKWKNFSIAFMFFSASEIMSSILATPPTFMNFLKWKHKKSTESAPFYNLGSIQRWFVAACKCVFFLSVGILI